MDIHFKCKKCGKEHIRTGLRTDVDVFCCACGKIQANYPGIARQSQLTAGQLDKVSRCLIRLKIFSVLFVLSFVFLAVVSAHSGPSAPEYAENVSGVALFTLMPVMLVLMLSILEARTLLTGRPGTSFILFFCFPLFLLLAPPAYIEFFWRAGKLRKLGPRPETIPATPGN